MSKKSSGSSLREGARTFHWSSRKRSANSSRPAQAENELNVFPPQWDPTLPSNLRRGRCSSVSPSSSNFSMLSHLAMSASTATTFLAGWSLVSRSEVQHDGVHPRGSYHRGAGSFSRILSAVIFSLMTSNGMYFFSVRGQSIRASLSSRPRDIVTCCDNLARWEAS